MIPEIKNCMKSWVSIFVSPLGENGDAPPEYHSGGATLVCDLLDNSSL
jgi:hypothetical protein